jgi:hypothetical protein
MCAVLGQEVEVPPFALPTSCRWEMRCPHTENDKARKYIPESPYKKNYLLIQNIPP